MCRPGVYRAAQPTVARTRAVRFVRWDRLVENLSRALAIVEMLVEHVDGLELSRIAETTGIPFSAAHRLLSTLVREGYVAQAVGQGTYKLTTRLSALGLSYLERTGLFDVAQPLIDGLAAEIEELVLLGVVRSDNLTWIAKAQGTRKLLRYDQPLGVDAMLACTASGRVWLASLAEERAVELALAQGLGTPDSAGPRAPATIPQLLSALRQVKSLGYSIARETSSRGVTAIAVPLYRGDAVEVIGALTSAGPSARFTRAMCSTVVPLLQRTADRLSTLHHGSSWIANRISSEKYTARPSAHALPYRNETNEIIRQGLLDAERIGVDGDG